jgi:hypothetical protein
VGPEFLKDGNFLCMKDLAIPLRVCVAGVPISYETKKEDLKKFTNWYNLKDGLKGLRERQNSIINKILEFAQQPLKAIYLGGDELTKDFDVLDAVGFSSAIPGLFHYDIMRDDPRMIDLVQKLLDKEKVSRLVDGGFVDNLPTKEAIKCVQEGLLWGYDPFVLALDCFSPHINRHWLFYPLMLFASENSRLGHELAHFSIRFKNVLSPVHFIPTKESFQSAIVAGSEELKVHLPFIRKMLGPIPKPHWL